VLRILKIAGAIFSIVLLLSVAQCVYTETSQRNSLTSLCEDSNVGKKVSGILDEARKAKFEIRSEIIKSDTERDWFNREYSRILKRIKKDRTFSESYTVVFAKPGIGYYACIIENADGVVTKSRFEDRSS